jgi:hypothetical protein
MSDARKLWFLAALGLTLLLAVGCRSRGETVATLSGFKGTVQRDHVGAVAKWEATSVGTTFVVGEAVRTAVKSTATLRLFEKDQLSLEPSTVLRFLERPSNRRRARVALELGEVSLHAADDALEVETELGTARIAPHAEVRLTRQGDATKLEVTIGTAEILRNGERWELEVGDAMDVHSERPLRRVPEAATSASVAAPAASVPEPASSATTAPEQAGATTPEALPNAVKEKLSRGPERVELVVRAGDSVVIHDPRPPTAVGVLAGGSCATGALLSIDPGRAPQETLGDAQVAGRFGAGSHRYSVRCLTATGERGEKVGEGTISVVSDAGSRQLAKTAPATTVETDGRRYTVLYQSLLPRISARWPAAPVAPGYTLQVTSPNGTKSFATSTPSYAFPAGALVEGEHQLTFEGNGVRSRVTSLAIRFDNAAPTASITSPADGSFAPGQQVLVAGTALPGWTVSVGSETLAQDSQSRFSATVASSANLGAIAIRFAQPKRGVHYYLRRCGR